MVDNNAVGFYTTAVGWALRVDVASGLTSVRQLGLGPVRLSAGGFSANPTFYVNAVNSHFEGDVWATAFRSTSDERLKENIETIEDPLQIIQAIRGVRFSFKDRTTRKDLNSHQRRVGVLAQDVQKVLPEAVTAAPDGYLSVSYETLIPVLLQAVKEQQRQIDALQKAVATLKNGQP